MKITFNIAPEGDWCVAISEDGKQIYAGHCLPDPLLWAVMDYTNIEEERVDYTQEEWEEKYGY